MIWRRLALAIGGGLLLFAGHPPLDLPLAGVVALVPLLVLARDVGGQPRWLRAAAGWGLLTGLVFFLPLLQWIMRFGLAPWVLLSVLQALSVALFCIVVAAWNESPLRPTVAVVGWVGLEWLRSVVPLSGFPWGLLGYTQHGGGPFLPVARTLGVLGIGLVLAGVSVAVEELVARRVWRHPRRAVMPAVVLGALVLVALLLGGDPPPATGETVDIAGVQGNTIELPPVVDRANVGRVEDVAALMVEATRDLAMSPGPAPQVVVWPENALDADPRVVPALADRVAAAQALIGDATLLAGTLLEGDRPNTFTNAIVQYDETGGLAAVYDKRVLVPFGEYVPLRSLLGGLPPLQAIASDGVPGEDPLVFGVGAASIGPVTCFESIFPSLVRDQVRAGANVLVVSTNNASFGRSPASRQHLAFSQVRAVETGRWILHAGISGISAVVDPAGGVTQQTELFERAIVRRQLPLIEGQTPFVRFGDVVGPSAAGLTAFAMVGGIVRRRRRGDAPTDAPRS